MTLSESLERYARLVSAVQAEQAANAASGRVQMLTATQEHAWIALEREILDGMAQSIDAVNVRPQRPS